MPARPSTPESVVREIKRRTRKRYNAEEKIRIVLEGLKGEASIAEICRREGINPNVYYKWSKDFLEACKKRLQVGDLREVSRSLTLVSIIDTFWRIHARISGSRFCSFHTSGWDGRFKSLRVASIIRRHQPTKS